MTKAANMKMANVKRTFSRMPRMFSPATNQMDAKTSVITRCGESERAGKKEDAFSTALTAEMQAVRM